jgi:hypothetical protein
LNDGVYTVAVGGVAGSIVVNEIAIVNEGAGAYVTLCKRSSPSNNCVLDNVTGLMWKRNPTGTIGLVERVGPGSVGKMNWYDTATCFTLHPAAADLQIIATPPTLRIVGGAGEMARYFAGMLLDLTGFANAINNLPGYRVTAVTVNGADLDLSIWNGRNTLIAEAAAGARDIRVVCRSIFAYCAGAIAVSFGGYTDWRIPNDDEFISLWDMEAPTGAPNATAFPNWPTVGGFWSSTTIPFTPSINARTVEYSVGVVYQDAKTNAISYFCELVRGGGGPF